jgi:hypothetical protein
MAFSTITQYLPGDEQGKQRWLLEHYLEHKQIGQALMALGFVPVDLPLQHMETPPFWLAAHQLVSQSQWTGIGGGQSVDLERVDWEKSDQLLDWFNIHTSWHYQARQALGL